MLLGACRWAVFPFFGAILLAAGSAGQTGREQKLPARPLDVQEVLSWLPHDTETVIVASDFTLPDLATLEKSRTYTQEWLFACFWHSFTVQSEASDRPLLGVDRPCHHRRRPGRAAGIECIQPRKMPDSLAPAGLGSRHLHPLQPPPHAGGAVAGRAQHHLLGMHRA